MSKPFGADPKMPHYIGGGDLWAEPDPQPPEWWQKPWLYPLLGATTWFFIALSFFFVGLSFWLAE